MAEVQLDSLDVLTEDEHRQEWTDEAARRDAELESNPDCGRPAEEVFRIARSFT